MRRFIRKMRAMFRISKKPVIFLDDQGTFFVAYDGEVNHGESAAYLGKSQLSQMGSIVMFLNAHRNRAMVIAHLYDKNTGDTLNLEQLLNDSEQLQETRRNSGFAINT